MDLFTKEGIPLLLPFPIKFGIPPLRSLRLTTGKWGEKVVFLALLAFELWFLSAHYHHLVSIGHSII
jgi:hypothetical protein